MDEAGVHHRACWCMKQVCVEPVIDVASSLVMSLRGQNDVGTVTSVFPDTEITQSTPSPLHPTTPPPQAHFSASDYPLITTLITSDTYHKYFLPHQRAPLRRGSQQVVTFSEPRGGTLVKDFFVNLSVRANTEVCRLALRIFSLNLFYCLVRTELHKLISL